MVLRVPMQRMRAEIQTTLPWQTQGDRWLGHQAGSVVLKEQPVQVVLADRGINLLPVAPKRPCRNSVWRWPTAT